MDPIPRQRSAPLAAGRPKVKPRFDVRHDPQSNPNVHAGGGSAVISSYLLVSHRARGPGHRASTQVAPSSLRRLRSSFSAFAFISTPKARHSHTGIFIRPPGSTRRRRRGRCGESTKSSHMGLRSAAQLQVCRSLRGVAASPCTAPLPFQANHRGGAVPRASDTSGSRCCLPSHDYQLG